MAVFFDRVVETANHILPFGVGFTLVKFSVTRLTRHREAIPVKQAFVEEHFHQWSQTANLKLGHNIFPAGFEIRQHRHPATDAGEIIDAQLHPGRMRHGEHVQRTALVDPPNAVITVKAFSNAFRVMMSRGRIPHLSKRMTASPAL